MDQATLDYLGAKVDRARAIQAEIAHLRQVEAKLLEPDANILVRPLIEGGHGHVPMGDVCLDHFDKNLVHYLGGMIGRRIRDLEAAFSDLAPSLTITQTLEPVERECGGYLTPKCDG